MKIIKALFALGGIIGTSITLYFLKVRNDMMNALTLPDKERAMLIERTIDANNLVFGILTPGGHQGIRTRDRNYKKLLGCSKNNNTLVYTFDDGSWLRFDHESEQDDITYTFHDTARGNEYTGHIDKRIIRDFKPINMNSADIDAIAELQ